MKMLGSGWDKVKGGSWKDSQGGGWSSVKGGETWKKGAWIIGGTGFVGALAYLHTILTPSLEDGKQSSLSGSEATAATDFTIPTALWATPLIAVGAVAGAAAYKLWLELQKTQVVALRIKPKQGFTMNNERVGNMARDFRTIYNRFVWRKRTWVKWQIIRNENKNYEFRLIVPADKKTKNKFTAYIKTCYPDVIITEEAPTLPDFFDPFDGEATHMKLTDKDKTLGLQNDLGNEMGDILTMMTPKSIMEFTFSPSSGNDIRRAGRKRVRELELQEKKGLDTRAEIAQVRARYTGKISAYDVFIDIWAFSGLEALASRISDRTERSNKLKGKPYHHFEEYRNPIKYDMEKRVLARWQSNKLTDKELSSFLMLPPKDHPVWEFIEVEKTRPAVSSKDFTGQYGIGYIDSDDIVQNGRVARLKEDTLTNHGLIAGASGGGKGSSLMMLVKTDFLPKWLKNDKNSMGMTLCDPHTEDITLILSHLLDLEKQGVNVPWDRVKVVSFGDIGAKHYPVAANLIHLPDDSDEDTIDKIAKDTEEVILSAFDSKSLSQSVSYLKKAMQGLLYSSKKKNRSLLDVVTLFEYSNEGSQLRSEVISDLTNEVVLKWWNKTDEEINADEKDKKVTAIDTRLSPLLDAKSMQRFFCRKGNYFDQIPQWLEDGCLVLIDFKGADDEMFRLGAAWLTKQYFRASQERGTGGRPHLLIFDEVQKFDATEIFFKILTENRKFDLGLILLTQEIEALAAKLRGAIETNAGFAVSVRQGKGGRVMSEILTGAFSPEELQELEKGLEACIRSFDGKARLKIDYPAYVWNGKETAYRSPEAKQAKSEAEKKMLELLKRDHKTAEQADAEVYEFVHGYPPVTAEDEATSNVVSMERAAGAEFQTETATKKPNKKIGKKRNWK
jgi:hypothetical protein